MTPDIRNPHFLHAKGSAASYYPEGSVNDAMRIFHDSAPCLQTAIFNVCDQAQMQQLSLGSMSESAINGAFIESFVGEIFCPFTECLPDELRSVTRDRFASNPAVLFSELHAILSGNPANDHHIDLVATIMPLGWKSILREYGIFTVLPMRIAKIVQVFSQQEPMMSPAQVQYHISLFNIHPFTNIVSIEGVDGIVHCPASKIVQKSVSHCVGYNISLVRTGVYGLSRINLIDGENSFRKTDAMCQDYELIYDTISSK